MLFVEERREAGPSLARAVVDGYRTLIDTFREVRKYKNLGLFLLAYWLYIDGVHTLFLMATDFGLRLGFGLTQHTHHPLWRRKVGLVVVRAF